MLNSAKILLTIAAIQFGFVPPVVDLTESHVFHQGWPPHARFHMVWALTIVSSLAAFIIFLIWSKSENETQRLKIVSILGTLVLGGFFVTTLTRESFGGALADPAHQVLILGIDGNVFAFGIAAIFQIIAMAIVWRYKA